MGWCTTGDDTNLVGFIRGNSRKFENLVMWQRTGLKTRVWLQKRQYRNPWVPLNWMDDCRFPRKIIWGIRHWTTHRSLLFSLFVTLSTRSELFGTSEVVDRYFQYFPVLAHLSPHISISTLTAIHRGTLQWSVLCCRHHSSHPKRPRRSRPCGGCRGTAGCCHGMREEVDGDAEKKHDMKCRAFSEGLCMGLFVRDY